MSMEAKQTILSIRQRIDWALEKCETNSIARSLYVEKLALFMKEMVRHSDNSFTQTLGNKIQEGFWTLDEKEMIEILSTPEWGKEIFSKIELSFLAAIYFWQLKDRFPLLYTTHLETFLQSALTDSVVMNSYSLTVKTLLALYGHDYFLKREPMIARIMSPTTGECKEDENEGKKKRGRKSILPQEDLVLFVYRMTSSTSSPDILVSKNGLDFEFYPLKHTRIKLIKKGELVKRTLETGIYSSRGVFLPVLGLQPFWQKQFVSSIVKDFIVFNQMVLGNPDSVSPEVLNSLLAYSQRFLGDRYTFKEYWEDLCNIKEFDQLFKSENFKEFILRLRNLNPDQILNYLLTVMTTL